MIGFRFGLNEGLATPSIYASGLVNQYVIASTVDSVTSRGVAVEFEITDTHHHFVLCYNSIGYIMLLLTLIRFEQ